MESGYCNSNLIIRGGRNFLYLLLIAARPAKPGARRSREGGRGTREAEGIN
jgi:hypothetical protein